MYTKRDHRHEYNNLMFKVHRPKTVYHGPNLINSIKSKIMWNIGWRIKNTHTHLCGHV
jgi:hypothetical protein